MAIDPSHSLIHYSNGGAGNLIGGFVLMLGAFLALFVASQEFRVVQLETTAAAGRVDAPLQETLEGCAYGCNPRMHLALARLIALDAVSARDSGRREASLRTAEHQVTQALASRPGWGQAFIELSFIRRLRFGARAPATRQALTASYRAAPYLQNAAPWRAELARYNWAELSPIEREAVLREAFWYAEEDAGKSQQIRTILADSAAGAALAARMEPQDRAISPQQPEQ